MTKKREFPHTIVVILSMLLLFAILTWILPPGEYESEEIDGRTRYIADSFHPVERAAQGPWDVMRAIAQGFTNNANLFFMIFIAGGAVYMLEQTESLTVIFKKLASMSSKATPLVVFIVMLFMSVVGSTGAFSNPIVALMPIGMMLAGALGYDKMLGFIIIYLGAFSGFNTGATNVFTVGIAHPIAELPMFSGFNVRIVFHAVNFLLNYGVAILYIKTLDKDPTKSLNYEPGMDKTDYLGTKLKESGNDKMTVSQKLSFLGLIVTVLAIVVGSLVDNWGTQHFTAAFMAMAIYTSVVNRYSPNDAVRRFIKGCATMTTAAVIIGFAGSLPVILNSGNIMHTIVYYLAAPIAKVGSNIGAVLMFWANFVINFFIPSGSGQAAAITPIMVPLADMTGITRQVAVQALQLGDGLSNIIVPTAATIMGCLGLANINFGKYLKWVLPLVTIQFVLASIAMFVLQSVGWLGY